MSKMLMEIDQFDRIMQHPRLVFDKIEDDEADMIRYYNYVGCPFTVVINAYR